MTNVVPISQAKAESFNILKKKSDIEILALYESISNMAFYYENADSFQQSYNEGDARKSVLEDKRIIEEYVRRFRPKLKGRI